MNLTTSELVAKHCQRFGLELSLGRRERGQELFRALVPEVVLDALTIHAGRSIARRNSRHRQSTMRT